MPARGQINADTRSANEDDASHAWTSLFVPGSGWIDLDPTNNAIPALEHMTIAWGHDFSAVTPLRGVINGGGVQTLEVKVTMAPALDEEGATPA